MKAEVRFQPKPDADYVFVTAEVSDDRSVEELIESVRLTMQNSASDNPRVGPFVMVDGKLVPWREARIGLAQTLANLSG